MTKLLKQLSRCFIHEDKLQKYELPVVGTSYHRAAALTRILWINKRYKRARYSNKILQAEPYVYGDKG